MSTVEALSQIQYIVQELDRLITEMTILRSQVSTLSIPLVQPEHSIREAEYLGMWADRKDMQGLSSREWLNNLRAQHWTRP
jgi:hypothetical protein